MKSNPSSCSATPFARCLGLLAVCFFTFAVASDAKAELTQAQVQAAFEAALDNFAQNSWDGNAYPIATLPLDYDYDFIGEALYHNGTASVGTSAYLTLANLVGVDPRFWNFLRTLVPSNDLARVVSLLSGLSGLGEITNGWGYATADTLHDQMDEIEYYLQGIWSPATMVDFRGDTHGNELLVAAPDLEDGLDTLDNDLRTYLTFVLDELSGVELSLDDLAQTIIAYWSESPASTESAAESAAEDEMEDEDADATDEFESIDLPDADEDDYEPAYAEGTVPDATLGLDDVESPVSHNALIRLVRGSASRSGGNDLPISSSGLPDIEIDFGRDSALVSGMSRFASWTEWLYGSLFALLFSVKGINMWRMVRVAFLAAGVGENPIVHLAWDPI